MLVGVHMKEHVTLLMIGSLVVLALFLNRLLTSLIPSAHQLTEIIIFNTVQFVVLMLVGWAAIRFFRLSILSAATVAGIVFAVDHFVLRTMYLVVIYYGSVHEITFGMYSRFIGPFLFFLPIAMLLGALGGFVSMRRTKGSN